MFTILSFFAIFTILSNVISIAELPFTALAYASFIPLILTFFLSSNREKEIDYPEILSAKTAREVEADYSQDNNFLHFFVIAAIAICILVTIFSIRSETDEAFYASMEIHAIERPDEPLFKYDAMFGEEDIPILHASYKFQSYEALSAVISYWTGIDPPLVRHVFFPVIATMLLILTWSKLFKLFLPNQWKYAIIIFVALIFLLGGYRSITGYSITRFYNGKCLLVHIIMPLCLYYSIVYFRNSASKNITYLTIIQIVGIGLSSSALFLLPLQTLIIGMINWKPNREQTKQCFIYGLSTTYLIIAAFFIKYQILQNGLPDPSCLYSEVSAIFYIKKILCAILDSLGGNFIARMMSLIAIFSAYRFLPKDSDVRKILFYSPLIVFFVILNPLFVNLLTSLFGKYIYWRLIYLLPVPLFITIFILGIANHINLKLYKKSIIIPLAILMLLSAPYIYQKHEYQQHNYSWNMKDIFFPRFDPESRVIAQYIQSHTPKSTRALAPRKVSEYLAGMINAPKLIAVNVAKRQKTGYVMILQDSFAGTAEKRMKMHQIVSGKMDDFDAHELSQYLEELNVGSVTFKKNLTYSAKLTNILRKSGYEKAHILEQQYECWLK